MSTAFKLPVPERPATRRMIRGMVDNYFAGIPWDGIGEHGHIKGKPYFASSSNSQLFNKYAGKTHEELVAAWNGSQPTLTTCNGLAGLMFNSLFASRKRGINGLDFDLKTQCLASAPLAWVSQSDDQNARPRYGDIMSYRPPELHASICLGAELGTWNVIQSGQGGKSVGMDIISKGSEHYPVNRIVGWINVAVLWDYAEVETEYRQLQKEWNESPWDAFIKMNRRK